MAPDSSPDTRPSRASALKRWAPLAILVAAMAFAFANGWHEQLTLSNLIKNRDLLRAYVMDHFALAMLAYAALYVVAVALSFPGASLITIAGGFVFGWAYGGLITAFAATIGATIIFSIARTTTAMDWVASSNCFWALPESMTSLESRKTMLATSAVSSLFCSQVTQKLAIEGTKINTSAIITKMTVKTSNLPESPRKNDSRFAGVLLLLPGSIVDFKCVLPTLSAFVLT